MQTLSSSSLRVLLHQSFPRCSSSLGSNTSLARRCFATCTTNGSSFFWTRGYPKLAPLHQRQQRPAYSRIQQGTRRWNSSTSSPPPENSSTSTPNPTPPPKDSRFQTAEQAFGAKNRSLLLYTFSFTIVVLGASYAAVPLYRAFCAATGFAGTPKTGMGSFTPEQMIPVENVRRIKVVFNADKSEQLPWTFTPSQRFVKVLPGESSLAFYRAKNKSAEDIIGIATYNVAPDRAAAYFSKVECFCFDEQKLLAGEEVDMPILFFIDKEILDDPQCRDVTEVILSYTFFRARRNQSGQLEPDAPDDVVQESLGFGGYEHAPKKGGN